MSPRNFNSPLKQSSNKSIKIISYPALLTCVALLILVLYATTSSSAAPLSSKLHNSRSGVVGGVQNKNLRNFKSSPVMAVSNLRGAASGGGILKGLPALLYGTAWKKGRTAELVEQAVRAGFRGIDTACQPKHYNEPQIGEALEKLYSDGVVTRGEMFLQTKFTSLSGQDKNNIPYDKDAPLAEQVRQSLKASLSNLRTDYLDSLILHSPMKTHERTLVVWRVFETFVADKTVIRLGLSNCYDLETLTALYNAAVVKPVFLQNRFYSDTGYDKEIRKFCRENGVTYQSFWSLTANPHVLKSPSLEQIATKLNKTPAQIFFAYIHSQGMIFLSGTTSLAHMADDLAVSEISLSAQDIAAVDQLLH